MERRNRLWYCFIIVGIISIFIPKAYGGTSITDNFIYPEYSKTISMDFKDAPLADVLKIFSQQSGLNFIAADSVANKSITLYLDKVPVEEALDRILTANNLTYEIKPDSNIFVVKSVPAPSLQRMTRVYQLKYATVTSSKLNNTLIINPEEDDDDTSSSSTTTTTTTTTTKTGDTGIVAAIRSVLSPEGTLTEDPRTNSVVITDVPGQFPLIEQTIARLDVPIPQVLIEVEMLDISENTAEKLGIKIGDTPLTFTGAERDHYYPWNENELIREGEATAPEYRVGTISAAGLSAALQMLRTQTDTKSLARPRILTLNNETAEIKITTNEAIGLTTQTGASEGVTTQSLEAERVETGVSLKVTPQVNLLTKTITLAVAPKVTEARTGATFQGQTFKDPEERATKSILRVHDGETVIIGGLIRNDDEKVHTKVPVLGDIPFVGAAFRHKNDSTTQRELVIFITPHIVPFSERSSALAYRSGGPKEPLIREQSFSSKRDKEIQKALTFMEKYHK